jgi:hypothetical protein
MKLSVLSRPSGVSLRDISIATPSDNLTEDTVGFPPHFLHFSFFLWKHYPVPGSSLPAPLPFGFKSAYGIEEDGKVCRASG